MVNDHRKIEVLVIFDIISSTLILVQSDIIYLCISNKRLPTKHKKKGRAKILTEKPNIKAKNVTKTNNISILFHP